MPTSRLGEFPDKANLPLSTLQNWLRYGRYGSYHYRKRRRVLPGGLAAQMSAFPADDVVAFMRAGNSAHAATKRFNIATEKQVQRLLFESGHPELCSPWYLRLRKHISTLPAESRPVTPSRGYTWSEIKEAVLVAFEKAARCAQLEAEVKRLAAENARLMSEMEEVRGTRRRKCEEEARFEAATQRGQGMPPFGSTQA
jgi:hypothetical protein